MPKQIYNDFSKGLAPYPGKVGGNGYFAEGRDVDIHRKYGYIIPGWSGTKVASSTDSPYVLRRMPIDIVVDASDYTGTPTAYMIDAIDPKIYIFSGLTSIATTHSSGAGSSENGNGITTGRIGIYTYLFYITGDNIGVYGSLNTNLGSGNWQTNWLTTGGTITKPANGAALNSSNKHPYLWWNTYLWVADGNKLSRFDGQTGAAGTWIASAIALDLTWEITALFSTQNYIGICAWKKVGTSLTDNSYNYNTESAVFFWDGTSIAYNYKVPVDDNYIAQAYNKDGTIYLVTQGKSEGASLRKMTDQGAEKLSAFKLDIGGTKYTFQMVGRPHGGYSQKLNSHAMDCFQNRLLMGMNTQDSGNKNFIFALGSPDSNSPEGFFQPYSTVDTSTASGSIGLVKQIDTGKIYVGYNNNNTYHLYIYSTGYSTNAVYKACYTDMGQKVRINYIKVYFDALVSGDSATVGIDVDYGTSHKLGIDSGNVSYGNDGAVTSKRFDKPIICHSFRPTIKWNSGGMAVSKIVIDYDFVDDL